MIQNIYFTIGILAILMGLDYCLTLAGQKFYKKAEKHYIKYESYELNPVFRESVKKNKYNLRHLLSFATVSLLLIYVHNYGTVNTFVIMVGVLFGTFFYINTKHIQNIFVFKIVAEEKPKGHLTIPLQTSLRIGRTGALTSFLLLLLVYLFSQEPIVLGIACGPLVLAIKQTVWLRKT